MELIDGLSNALVSSYATWIWCGLTALIFLVFVAKLSTRVHWLNRMILETSGFLGQIKDPQEFTARFEDIRKQLSDHRIWGKEWNDFLKSLLLPNAGSDIIRGTIPPTAFFSVDSALDGHIARRLYEAVPGLLTGLGILGTFAGLSAGIYLISPELSKPDAEAMKVALGRLLGGASLAFLTSVTGLFCSLIFLLYERMAFRSIERGVAAWCLTLDRLIPHTSIEEIASLELRESREQTLQLKRFNDDLAVSIAEALDEKMTKRLAPELQRMIEQVKTVSDRAFDESRQHTSQLVRINEELAISLASAIGDKLDSRLGPGVDQLVSSIDSLRSDRGDSNEKLIRELVTQFTSTMSGAAGTEIGEMAKTLQGLALGIQETARQLSESGSHAGEQFVQASREAASTLSAVVLEFDRHSRERHVEQERAHIDSMERMNRNMESVVESLTQAAAGVHREISTAANDAGEALTTAAELIGESSTKSQSGLQAVLERLSSEMRAISELFERAQSNQSGLDQTILSLEKTLNHMSDLQHLIRETATPLISSATEMKSVGNELRAALGSFTAVASQLGQMAGTIGSAATTLDTTWSGVHSRFHDIDQSLAKSFREISDGVEAYSRRMKEFVEDLDRTHAVILSRLSESIEELNGAVEQLEIKTKQT